MFNMMNRRFLFPAAAILLAVCLFFGGTGASAEPSSGELKAQLEQLEQESQDLDAKLEQLEQQYSANRTELAAMVQQKENIDQQIFLLHEQITNTEDQIATYRLLIADTQVELEEAQARLEALNELHKDRIRTMEEDGRISYWSVLFKANSFSDLLDRLSMMQEIAASDRRRLDELRDAAQAVNDAQEALKEEKAALEQIQQEQQDTYAQLEEKRAEAETLLDQLEDMGVEYESLMDDGELLQQQLAEQIAQAEKDYDAAKYNEWLATSVPPTPAPPPTTKPTEPPTKPTEPPTKPTEAPTKPTEAPTEPTTEPAEPTTEPTEPATEPTEAPTEPPKEEKPAEVVWLSPLLRSSYVTSPYGMRVHPISGKYKMHHGVDLYSFRDDPLVATRSGVVTTTAYQEGGAGYYVTINHGDGFSSTYMHMTHYVVKKGDYVTAGQIIGYVGSSGGTTGPHLHFGIFYNGSSVNPVNYVNFA